MSWSHSSDKSQGGIEESSVTFLTMGAVGAIGTMTPIVSFDMNGQ